MEEGFKGLKCLLGMGKVKEKVIAPVLGAGLLMRGALREEVYRGNAETLLGAAHPAEAPD